MAELSDIASYVTEKVSSDSISLEEYITTDNILQNKAGKTIAANLPPNTCSLTAFKEGDILVANIRPYLKKIWKADSCGAASNDVLVFRAKDNHDSDFLYAVLLQDSFFEHCMKGAEGAKMPRGNKSNILRFPVPALSIEQEHSVGNLISNLDKKITLNRQTNCDLEAMAKQLYDYWFVQFDFPNAEGKPYKSSGGKMVWNETLKREIPEGWFVDSISKILQPSMTKISQKDIDKLDNYTPIEVIPRNEMSFSETSPIENATSGLCRYKKKSILMSNRRVYFHKISIAPFDGITRDTVIVLNSSDSKYYEYAFFTLNDESFTEFATRHSYGSEQPVFSWESASQYYIAIPKNNLLESFGSKIKPIIDKVLTNHLEMKELRNQRDALLPLLMNGQVTVKQ